MPRKKRKLSGNEIRSAKKAAILDEKRSTRLPLIAAALCVVFIAAGATLYTLAPTGGSGTAATTAVTGAPPSGQVEYNVALFNDGRAKYFSYKAGKQTINYFILKSADGIIRAAFDACDVCWPAGKGYVQQGDQMVCRNCGRKFDSVRINEVKGGCNPAPLKRRIEGDLLILRMDDILDGRQYFNFSQKA